MDKTKSEPTSVEALELKEALEGNVLEMWELQEISDAELVCMYLDPFIMQLPFMDREIPRYTTTTSEDGKETTTEKWFAIKHLAQHTTKLALMEYLKKTTTFDKATRIYIINDVISFYEVTISVPLAAKKEQSKKNDIYPDSDEELQVESDEDQDKDKGKGNNKDKDDD
ncbi:hypothetical protein BG006_010782 [Podila minutissima]|uniref:Uncharacterized protein n=1 Tax=Podila minutissima TaxID=64525 RepID=A0A9P5VIB8_9FUNG|nr:hypothetical protein BG006_010782 [Podila minutissima]